MQHPRTSADNFAKQLFDIIQTEIPADAPVPKDKQTRVGNELVYLSIFLIDLGVYLVLNQTPIRQLVMDHLLDLVNASGLSMDVLGQRMQAYTDAARAESRAEALTRLGQAFAWQCLSPADSTIANVGATVAAKLTDQVVAMTQSTTLTP